jgi:sugar transferase (PEP-CTERM/EpsH1 system associated)
MNDPRPLIAHVVYHFGTGGMENGVVMLFNTLPEDKYRHVVISLTDHGAFRQRIHRHDIAFHDIGKRPGQDPGWYWRLAKLLRQIKPDLLHTRNLAAMEAQFVAALTGVPRRVHGEHGRDMYDLHGSNWKYNLLRRLARLVVHRYIAVSRDLADWLREVVGVPEARIRQIYNGVDGERFHPRQGPRPDLGRPEFFEGADWVIGSVGRLVRVKDYPTLIRAFDGLRRLHPHPESLRLILVGEGPERGVCETLINELGLSRQVWLPGDRTDTPDWYRAFDVFALPSLGEGISNTILEAMASGLPIVATEVGGTPELVREGENGAMTPAQNPEALARALLRHTDASVATPAGQASRARIEQDFIIPRMAAAYAEVYDSLLKDR